MPIPAPARSAPTNHKTAVAALVEAPPALRLRLAPTGTPHTLLDGGWWPRSDDPLAELPGLVLAIDDRHRPIARIMLGVSDWGPSRPRMLRMAGPAATRIVRLGWFASMPAGLLTAICSDGNRIDLLTVPPYADERAAQAAMEQAARTDNLVHTPEILCTITAPAIPTQMPSAQIAVAEQPERQWESEGGR